MLTVNGRTPAAQYLRRSTEHQQYSFENQSDWNAHYEEAHGMEIVRTYSDVESGVNLRDGLEKLIEDVETSRADYRVILVYDVSRWGRFQDIDESAYYEYRCKRSGVAVHYCAEQFDNDSGFLSSLFKSIKRSMAGEYSRELSAKVFAGQVRLVRLGFHMCGASGYGLRRQLVDRDRNPKGLLAPREAKSIQSDRIILVPGPPDEVNVVKEIYSRYINGWDMARIARWINTRGLPSDTRTPWTNKRVQGILTNEKYSGTNVFNRQSAKVGCKAVYNPPERWVRCEGAFTPIVSREVFAQAQSTRLARCKKATDAELLSKLRALWQRTGTLSSHIVEGAPDIPCGKVYVDRFGSLTHAYALIGFIPKKYNFEYTSANRRALELCPGICNDIARQLRDKGASVDIESPSTHLRIESPFTNLRINGEFTAAVILAPARHKTKKPGKYQWIIRAKQWRGADVAVVVRLTPGDLEILDYYCFPTTEPLPETIKLLSRNDLAFDVFRFDTLDPLIQMSRHSRVGGSQ